MDQKNTNIAKEILKEFQSFRNEIRNDMQSFRNEIRNEIQSLRNEFQSFKNEMNNYIKKNSDIQEMKVNQSKETVIWMFASDFWLPSIEEYIRCIQSGEINDEKKYVELSVKILEEHSTLIVEVESSRIQLLDYSKKFPDFDSSFINAISDFEFGNPESVIRLLNIIKTINENTHYIPIDENETRKSTGMKENFNQYMHSFLNYARSLNEYLGNFDLLKPKFDLLHNNIGYINNEQIELFPLRIINELEETNKEYKCWNEEGLKAAIEEKATREFLRPIKRKQWADKEHKGIVDEEKLEKGWYFITIRPHPDLKFEKFKTFVELLFKRKAFSEGFYVWEQKGTSPETMGNGFHIHAVIKASSPSKGIGNVKEIIYTAMKKCGVDDSIGPGNYPVRALKTEKELESVKHYTETAFFNKNDEEKQEAWNYDAPWRASTGLASLYQVGERSRSHQDMKKFTQQNPL